MLQGIKQVAPDKKVTVITLEKEAIADTISKAEKDAFIVICSDVIPDALEQIMELKTQEDSKSMG